MLRPSRLIAAAVGLIAAAAIALTGPARADTIRVEGESFVTPNGVSTLGSGPNASKVVTVDPNSSASGGSTIGWFGSWDWLEYTVTAPSDGVYNLSFFYADADTTVDPLPVMVTNFTTGKQYLVKNIHSTPSWAYADYTTVVAAPDDASAPYAIPLKAGANRFRVAIRSDFVMAGAMNIDYMDFTKTTEAYPSWQAVTGTVTTQIGGVSTPLAGALISEGADNHTASNITRTDSTGAYTLYVTSGSHSLTAFANGFAPNTVSASAPGTTNFAMTANGKYEAELLDSTNTGPEVSFGEQPAYDSGAASGNTLSNFGEIVNSGPGKYAEYKSVYAPADGVYDLSIHYASMASVTGAVGDPGYLTWTVNTTNTVKMTYTTTSATDWLTYADSTPILVTLKKGVNTLRFTDANAGTGGNPATPSANIDYFTVAPSTQPHGTLNITVTDLAAKAIGGANITVPLASPQFTGLTGSNGVLAIPVPPGTYAVTANKSGAANAVTVSSIVVADGQTVNVPIQLNISGAAVEAEDYTSGGPGVPPATITDLASASGSKVVTGFTGSYLQGWLEWTVNVSADGLYRLTMQYSIPSGDDIVHPVYPIDMTVNVFPSTFHAHTTNIPRTENGDTYGGYDLQDDSANVILIPLKAGDNKIRLSLASGTMNLDYIQVTKLQAYPTNVRTITGTIYGSDNVGSAPIAGAKVWLNNSGIHTTYDEAQFATTTDANGLYSITAYTGGAFLNASANGFIASNLGSPAYILVSAGTSTKDATIKVNPPTSPATGTEQVDAYRLTSADTRLATNESMITFTQPGTYFGLPLNVARAGMYQVGMYYSSGWNSGDGNPVKTTWTVNGVDQAVNFDKTVSWLDFQFFPSIASIPLNAGGNTLKVSFVEAGANIVYFTLTRTGALPPPSTNVYDVGDSKGKTDLMDAVMYARRLAGLDTGAKPDLTSDGLSNASDVARILRVAGGLN